jgi:hypothetical protein
MRLLPPRNLRHKNKLLAQTAETVEARSLKCRSLLYCYLFLGAANSWLTLTV